MVITPISNRYNCCRVNQNSENKHAVSCSNTTTIPSFVDAKSFVNINFKGKIHDYAKNGMRGDLQKEIIDGTDINSRDSMGNTPLICACGNGLPETIKWLLEQPEIDVNAQNSEGLTALMKECKSNTGNAYIVDQLVRHPDIKINLKDHFEETALIHACKNRRADIVETLLQDPDIDVNAQNIRGYTALMYAADFGYKDVVEKLLTHPDVDTELKDDKGKTARDLAGIRTESERMIRNYQKGIDKRTDLIQRQEVAPVASTNTTEGDGYNALKRACENANFDEANRLLQNPNIRVNPTKTGCDTPLMWACYKGGIKTVELLLQRPDIDINAQDGKTRNTALIFAANQRNKEIVKKLLTHPDIDINIRNKENRCALDYANQEIADLINAHRKDIDINARANDENGTTLLIRACSRGDNDLIDILLQNPDIDINATDKEGSTALIWACFRGWGKAAEKLLDRPEIDVNVQNSEGHTALMWAAKEGKSEMVEKLLLHPDIDVNLQTQKDKLTALMCALYSKDKKTVEKMLEHPYVDINLYDSNGKLAFNYADLETRDLILNYQKGVDKRTKSPKSIPVDINNLSPEKNIWSEKEITDQFKLLVTCGDLDRAEQMLMSTPLINLEGDENPVLKSVCATQKPKFVRKVFAYQDNQSGMRADYEAKRKEFLENTIQTLSYEELKESPVALYTEDGFKILMSKKEFNPNDIVREKSLFDLGCRIDKDGSITKEILSKHDDIYTGNAKKFADENIRTIIKEYETTGKYQVKLEKIKRNLSKPETRDVAIMQLSDYINSEEFKPELTDSFGNSLLHIIASAPDDRARGLIQKVLTKGVDKDSVNITKQNALISAIKTFRITSNDEDKTKLLSNIKFLIDKGIDVNAPDSNGQTAFHHACSSTSPALLSLILSKEPNIFMKDNLGHRGQFYIKSPEMKGIYNKYTN